MSNKDKYDIFDTPSNQSSNLENELALQKLIHELELERVEISIKKFEHRQLIMDFLLKISQLILINTAFVFAIYFSYWYVGELIKLSLFKSNALYILGPFALGFILSLLYICGSVFRALFKSRENSDPIISNTLDLISKLKDNSNKT